MHAHSAALPAMEGGLQRSSAFAGLPPSRGSYGETGRRDRSARLIVMSNPSQLVQKLWNYCNILRDDGLSYGDYVEQLTFLLFLKMADEQSRPPLNKPSPIPKGKDWPALLARDGDDLEIHYRHTLEELGKRSGMLGVIFRKAQNKIQDRAKLHRLIADLVSTDEHGLWTDTFTPTTFGLRVTLRLV